MFENLQSISFSKVIQHNIDGKVVLVDSSKVAYAAQNELILENLNSNEKKTRYVCDYIVDFISLSPDSELMCCGMFKHNLIQVWSFVESCWRCKISEGLLEISSILWAPDSRHLLVSSENNFKITIWSLVSVEVTVIENPKYNKGCISFSNCSKYMAVLERKNLMDYIGIYACDGWQLLKCFQIKTENAVEIQFSPSDLVLSITAAFSDECKVLFYSIDGRLLTTFEKTGAILGITSLSWSPNNNCVILSNYFEKIILLDGNRYKEIYTFDLPESVCSLETNIYRMFDTECNSNDAFNSNLTKYEVVKERPFSLLSYIETKKIKNKISKRGIQFMQFSNDGQYVAIVSYSSSNVLFLLDLKTFLFCDIIILNSKIKTVKWHPNKHILVFTCGSNILNLWTPTSCIHLISPYESKVTIKNVDWFPNGESLIMNGKDCSTILYLP